MTIRRLLNYWFKKKRTGFYLWMGTGAAVLYFVGVMLDSSRSPGLAVLLRRLGFSGFIVVITAFFAHLNLHCVHWFLDHFKDTDHLPKRQMALVNSFCMTLFLCLCLGALPGTAWALEPLWQAIRQWFAGRAGLEDSVYPTLPMETEAMEAPDLSQLLGEAKPTPGWVLTADQVLRAAAIILVAVVLLMVVRAALRGIWAWVTRPRQFDSDEKIYLTPTWALASGDKAKAGIRLRFSPRSYGHKIRRQYRREILTRFRKEKLTLSPALSPAELEETAGLYRPALHQLYEKARYSSEDCTREDWETVSKTDPGRRTASF